MTTKKSANKSAKTHPAKRSLVGTALEGTTPGMPIVELATGPNVNGLRYQAALAQQPDDAARQAALTEIEAEG